MTPTKRRILWTLGALAAAAGIVVTMLIVLLMPYEHEGPTPGGYYMGTLPDGRAVTMTLYPREDKLGGSIELENDEHTGQWIEGEIDAGGSVRIDVNPNQDVKLHLRGKLDDASGRLTGELIIGDGPPQAMAFDRVMTNWRIERRTGVRIGDRGWAAHYTAEVPDLKGSPLRDAMRAELMLMARASAGSLNESTSWRDVWESMWEPSATNYWEGETSVEMLLDDPTMISAVITDYAYTGGAHGNSNLNARVFAQRDDGSVGAVVLEDVIVDTPAAKEKLVELCCKALRAAGATSLSDYEAGRTKPPISIDNLHTFAVVPSGLRFYFSPYEVGSYAEGAYSITIPWGELAGIMIRDGPVAKWLEEKTRDKSAR
ncbi:MAG: DUF3298 domain-containing protein [Planctomycetes bacterium]|nr:DUF3298 domain-containing protein [Planctomycetota bacterium]